MKITLFTKVKTGYISFVGGIVEFCSFLLHYIKRKIIASSVAFEKYKNRLVRFFMIKRGKYNRPFLHFATMSVLGIGIMVGPFLADTYPVFSSNSSAVLGAQTDTVKQSIDASEDVFSTKITQKPRDKVIIYSVQKGDTLSTIAKKYQISEETLKWANDLTDDSLTVGDQLKILPVTGTLHKVAKGDTVYTIAKKYDTEAQKIVDFPFNDFANSETFSLVEGQMLIVPDGIKPSERSNYVRPQLQYVAQGPVTISGAGFTWPLRGGISQYASWYHMALDITSPVETPIVAAHDGVVSRVSLGTWDYGYGNNVWVNGATARSRYAHMTTSNVVEGQQVYAGKTVVGWVGMTGRTTGPHLHFEIEANGHLVDPMQYLR